MNRILTHGKCILAGEHAVLRGSPAVVAPLLSRPFTLEWERTAGAGIEVEDSDLARPFRDSLHFALEHGGTKLPEGRWRFRLESGIPLRAGLGSSAALSVAVARFLGAAGVLRQELFPAALAIENLFHGTSSGIDVAAAMSAGPIRFSRGFAPVPLSPAWQPKLYLSDTGLRSSTKTCVEKVQRLARKDIDDKMAEAARATEIALGLPEADGVIKLAAGMRLAGECFREWNLVPEEVARKIASLEAAGALAVKPTGSGDGGFLLSLWAEAPSDKSLIPVWS